MQLYPAQGFVTLVINFHGSTSFGHDFTRSISKNWGGLPFDDIMKGVDFAVAQYSWIDSTRMCALGASYGGVYACRYVAVLSV